MALCSYLKCDSSGIFYKILEKLTCEGPYVISIKIMHLRLLKLQESNSEAKELKSRNLLEG